VNLSVGVIVDKFMEMKPTSNNVRGFCKIPEEKNPVVSAKSLGFMMIYGNPCLNLVGF